MPGIAIEIGSPQRGIRSLGQVRGFDGLRGFSRHPLSIGPLVIDIQNDGTLFYYFVLVVFGA